MAKEITKVCTKEAIDAPGSDPAPFANFPRSIGDIERMPPEVAKAWNKAFVSEIRGVLTDRNAYKTEDPLPDDKVIPFLDVCHCKLNMDSLVDKLKVRVIFRGDLYNPKNPQDSWNPHASFADLKIFMANCARQRMYPKQFDYQLAYLQAKMREQVFVRFPESWKKCLPEHLNKCIGRLLLLLMAPCIIFQGRQLQEQTRRLGLGSQIWLYVPRTNWLFQLVILHLLQGDMCYSKAMLLHESSRMATFSGGSTSVASLQMPSSLTLDLIQGC